LGIGSICNWFGFSWGFVKAVVCYYGEETLIGYWDFDARRGTMLSCIGRLTKMRVVYDQIMVKREREKEWLRLVLVLEKGKVFFNGLFFQNFFTNFLFLFYFLFLWERFL
jgi:hypothetical protein